MWLLPTQDCVPKDAESFAQENARLPNSLHFSISWASLVTHRVKKLPAMLETWVQFLGWEDSLGEGNSYPLQYSGLENSMDRGTWQATVHGVAKSRTRLSDFHFHQTQKVCCPNPPDNVPALIHAVTLPGAEAKDSMFRSLFLHVNLHFR